MNWSEDPWLGGVLGKPCYNLTGEISRSSVIPAIEGNGPALFSAKIDTGALGVARQLEEANFHLVDTNLTLKLDDFTGLASGARKAQQEDESHVRSIASNAFFQTRFHSDPEIKNDIANTIKEEWVGNYFKGNRGDAMIVSIRNKEVVGFLLALLNKEIIIIDLIAVGENFKNQGCGKEMIGFLWELYRKENRYLQVGTQITNIESLAFYQSLGFVVEKYSYVFHKHL